MRSAPLARLVLVACLLALFAPAAGCGAKKKSKKGLTVAQRLEKARSEKTPESKARELTKVARVQLTAGDRSGAARTLSEARKEMPAEADAAVWAPCLVDIARGLADAEDRTAAKEVLKLAVDKALTVEDPISRIRVLAEAGAIYGAKSGGMGEAAFAKDVLGKGVEAAAGVEERFKAQALAALAIGYAKAGLAADAGKMVDELETSAKALEDLRPKAEALAAAASVRGQKGEKEAAAALLKEAAEAAKAISGAANKTYALVEVASAYLSNGDPKTAGGLLKTAEKSAGEIGDPEAAKNALEKVRGLQRDVDRRK